MWYPPQRVKINVIWFVFHPRILLSLSSNPQATVFLHQLLQTLSVLSHSSKDRGRGRGDMERHWELLNSAFIFFSDSQSLNRLQWIHGNFSAGSDQREEPTKSAQRNRCLTYYWCIQQSASLKGWPLENWQPRNCMPPTQCWKLQVQRKRQRLVMGRWEGRSNLPVHTYTHTHKSNTKTVYVPPSPKRNSTFWNKMLEILASSLWGLGEEKATVF